MLPPSHLAHERQCVLLDRVVGSLLEAVCLAKKLREATQSDSQTRLGHVVEEYRKVAECMEVLSRELADMPTARLWKDYKGTADERGAETCSREREIASRCEKIAELAEELALLQRANHALLSELGRETERFRECLLAALGEPLIYCETGSAVRKGGGSSRVRFSA